MKVEQLRLKYVSLDYLLELSGGDTDFILDMILTFLNTAPGYMTDFELLREQKDWYKMSRAAHKFKSSFSVIGSDSLTGYASAIEKLCKEEVPDVAAMDHAIGEMKSLFLQVMAELEDSVKKIKETEA